MGLIVIGFPGESLADMVLNKTNRIKRCSVAAYRINRLLALLFPMILFVSANTALSKGLSACIALCASYVTSAMLDQRGARIAYPSFERLEGVHALFILILVSANIILTAHRTT